MIKPILKGLLTNIPGWHGIPRKEGGGANSARYCYAVWLRHRVLAAQAGFKSPVETLVEFGPGDSIGTGLAALLSGCKRYISVDIVPFTRLCDNLSILDELVSLFSRKAPIPDNTEFGNLEPSLSDYGFPANLFSDDLLRNTLNDDRINRIRSVLTNSQSTSKDVDIVYVAPWNVVDLKQLPLADMVLSQAVMEHVEDLQSTYRAMHEWLKPGGIMSHEIDFKNHGTAKKWNGHWAYSDALWKIIKGRRKYFLNRQALGHHIMQIEQEGFEIMYIARKKRGGGIRKDELCKDLAGIGPDDLLTSSAFVLARKRETDEKE